MNHPIARPSFLIILIGLLTCAAAQRATAAPPPATQPTTLPGSVVDEHVMLPMRDGTRLSTYLYFPPGKGPWPVLYQERYADIVSRSSRESFARLARAGYVVAMQNFRGSRLSEGKYVGYRALGWGRQQDGYDSVEWLASQSWSTGKIGTFGGSQAGFAQNFLAVTQPPHLVCQFMTDTGLSLFHEGYRIGGVTRPERFKTFFINCRNPADNLELLNVWFQHPDYDDYWKDEDCTLHFDKMNVPCFTLGSWYDFMCVGSIDSFIGRENHGGPNSRGQQQLLIGPWVHGGTKGNVINEMTFPENARFDWEKQMMRWFDHYLKGVDNGVDREAKVRYYVMGPSTALGTGPSAALGTGEKDSAGNIWRSASTWPVPSTQTPYYLHEDGKLSTDPATGETSATTFKADPLHPAQIPSIAFPGAKDARSFEKQPDVRTFTTDVLAAPVDWTGKVRAELFVSSTAPDSDFIVRVSDVYPDGRSILIIDYVRRARYRDGYDHEVMMKPGEVYKIAFDVGSLSQVFNKGHRIRVTIASTGAPFYEPNPNTGEALTLDFPAKTQVAENTVYHNQKYASRVLAPIVARASRP